jgi:hypothetical protein
MMSSWANGEGLAAVRRREDADDTLGGEERALSRMHFREE